MIQMGSVKNLLHFYCKPSGDSLWKNLLSIKSYSFKNSICKYFDSLIYHKFINIHMIEAFDYQPKSHHHFLRCQYHL